MITEPAHDGTNGAWAAAVYAELRRTAASLLGNERKGHTLEPTALVHEAWLRLSESRNASSIGRTDFLGLAVQAMRRILVDRARAHATAKRGGGARRTTLSHVVAPEAPHDNVLTLEAALAALECEDPELAHVVELRFFGGCTTEEIAEVVGLSPRTVKRRWRFARAWLHRWMTEGSP